MSIKDDGYNLDYEVTVRPWDASCAVPLGNAFRKRCREYYAWIARNHFSDYTQLLHVGVVPSFILGVVRCIEDMKDYPPHEREVIFSNFVSVAHSRVVVTDQNSKEVGELHLGVEQMQRVSNNTVSIFLTSSKINSVVANAFTGFFHNWDKSTPPRQRSLNTSPCWCGYETPSVREVEHFTFWMDLCLDVKESGKGWVDGLKIERSGTKSSSLDYNSYREIPAVFSVLPHERRVISSGSTDSVTYNGEDVMSTTEFDKSCMIGVINTYGGKRVLALTHISADGKARGGSEGCD